MNLLLINSGENDAFASVYAENSLITVKCSEFISGNEKAGRSPDKLINCLVKLRSQYDFGIMGAIAVTTGPGSFTGIRVGLALAKGIAEGISKPLIPVNNFSLMYEEIPGKDIEKFYCVLIPAKKPEYYYSVFKKGTGQEFGCLDIDEILKKLEKNTIIAGNFGNESVLKHSYFTVINLDNNGINKQDAMLKLALNSKPVSAENVEPLYVKDFLIKKS